MKKGKIIITVIILSIALFYLKGYYKELGIAGNIHTSVPFVSQEKIAPSPSLTPIPEAKTLESNYHIFQTYNNCGPAALSMALNYYSISVTQQELGIQLRPFQVPGGDNDDKSVTLSELAQYSNKFGFTAIHRPMGNIDLLKNFIALGFPVIARTWTKTDEDIGHFRIIKGYDDAEKILIQDDSLQGKNLKFSYDEFNMLWKKFNYEFLVLIPPDTVKSAQKIIGENYDEKKAWQNAVKFSQNELENDSTDKYARFNLSVALYHTGDYANSVVEFEKIENSLPFRTLWYQLEPVYSYYELKDYENVNRIAEKILSNGNRAYSELYILKGKILKNQGKIYESKEQFKKAEFYNSKLKEAKELLEN